MNSTFGEIDKKHQINGIQNTINNLIVYVDNIDAYFILDKKNLPLELRLEQKIKIEKLIFLLIVK